jgi:hypothetical protein
MLQVAALGVGCDVHVSGRWHGDIVEFDGEPSDDDEAHSVTLEGRE